MRRKNGNRGKTSELPKKATDKLSRQSAASKIGVQRAHFGKRAFLRPIPIHSRSPGLAQISRHEVRDAGRIHLDVDMFELQPSDLPNVNFTIQPFRTGGIGRKVVEHEVAQAVDDGAIFVPIDGLRDVRVAADDGVQPRIDQPAGQRLLLFGGLLF